MTLARQLSLALIAFALVISQAQAAPLHLPRIDATSVLQHAGVTVGLDQGDQDDESQARDRGVVQGEIVGIDFERGVLHLQTQRRGRVDIQILPSTSIVRRGQYGTIADLTQGTHVSVNVSEVGGRLVAQIIRMR